MKESASRREFLADVGRGMLVVSLGASTATELGLGPVRAGESNERLTFGSLEPLVTLLQETLPDKLLPALVEKLKQGTDLKTLVSAASLANARAFGGQDYTGYHTFMALAPAYHMARRLPDNRRPLPVLKVLYRNSSRIQERGLQHDDTLHPVEAVEGLVSEQRGEWLRDAVRAADWQVAEARFAALAKGEPGEAFNHLQFTVQDEVDVHRVVLAWRAWAMLELAGAEYAHTLLRQSVRYCLEVEQSLRNHNRSGSPIRQLLPRLLEEYRLTSVPLGTRKADDAWVEQLAQVVFAGTRKEAAEAVAAALAEGFDPEAVGEAISLAANKLVLHDPGRRPEYSSPQKPPGCVHGDSVGVHASDAANAWRNIARVSNRRNKVASLIVGAFHTAGQTAWVTKEPYPFAERLGDIRTSNASALLAQTEEAIRANDQARACALVYRYGQLGYAPEPVFDLLLKYAVSEDGALHAEKYYRTVTEEFATTRPAFRWRQLVALARVTASEYGFPAPGYAQACELLGLS
ncbi:MAG: hypothetical protein KatS3mg110_4329 [Pirellulaceae bacterium]|nr:MAG: hypothetical protein KatS3mg110_4329 [Pirellulaceae bacterium]